MNAMNEYNYFMETNFGQYKGKWVALLSKEVVASGDSFKEVAELIDEKKELSKALITRIPEEIVQLL